MAGGIWCFVRLLFCLWSQLRAVRARRHLASAAGVQVGLDSEVGGPDTARDAINKTRVCAVDHWIVNVTVHAMWVIVLAHFFGGRRAFMQS